MKVLMIKKRLLKVCDFSLSQLFGAMYLLYMYVAFVYV